MQAYTVQSAQAALALGLLRAVCNHCGARHLFVPAEPCSRKAMRCIRRRVAYGIWNAYQSYSAHFPRLGNCISDLRNPYPMPPFSDAFNAARDSLYSAASYACLFWHQEPCSNRITPLVDYSYMRMVERCLGYHLLSPDHIESRWVLLPPEDEVRMEIARICLNWICDERLWQTIHCELRNAEAHNEVVVRYGKAKAVRDIIIRTAPALAKR